MRRHHHRPRRLRKAAGGPPRRETHMRRGSDAERRGSTRIRRKKQNSASPRLRVSAVKAIAPPPECRAALGVWHGLNGHGGPRLPYIRRATEVRMIKLVFCLKRRPEMSREEF